MRSLRILIILVAFADATFVYGAEPEYSVVPIALIVAERYPHSYRNHLVEGKWTYDETFRQPSRPVRGATVHCSKTDYLGAAFLIRRSRAQPLKQYSDRIRHEWTHEDPATKGQPEVHRHPMRFGRYSKVVTSWELLELQPRRKRDGQWTLRSYIDGEQVAEEIFNLIDCAGEYDAIEIPELLDIMVEQESEPPEQTVDEQGPERQEEIVCTREKLTGSHRTTTVCRTRTVIEREREDGQSLIRDIQDYPGDNRPQ